ncbi:MAG: thioredoxin family protein [Syntrophales bacterium]
MKTADKCVMVDDEQGLSGMLKTRERVIALFYASWCPFCASFLPVFERHAAGEGLTFLAVKDDQESMGDSYSVEIVPTALFFEKGKVSRRLDGVPGAGLNEKQLIDFIQACALPNCPPVR